MKITWHGHSCFRLTERGMATVVTDPYNHKKVGYQELNLSADIITVSHDAPGHNHTKIIHKRKSQKHIITGPGEYEIGEVFITGIRTNYKVKEDQPPNVMYIFDYNGVLIAHLGNLKKVPSQSDVKLISGDVHVALVPVGGGSSLTASKAVEVIRILEPSYAIPMYYHTEQSKLELDPLDNFIKEMGLDKVEPRPDLSITSTRSSSETNVVVLEYAQESD
ncbi:MAG: MBL fold metallo-hydrolase [Anaerolineales bacterium]|nr:MBL fold metallo-hydrolase [Anaerolineales bacterium]